MSSDEAFLARWSRRKRNVTARADADEKPPPGAAGIARPVAASVGDAAPAISLPPIDSIDSASDIKAFLAPGVPLELTRAALRRAWTADPAIRDFVGLSENAWDFNAPGEVPGFGSLDLGEVRRLVAQLLDKPRIADPTSATAALADHSATAAEAAPAVPMIEMRENTAVEEREDGETEARQSRARRRHGGALPQS